MSNLGIIGDGSNGIKRRTVVKGAMWSVPVVVAAMAAPLAAASGKVPPTPVIDFGTGSGTCGNTGATTKGCGGDKTLQVALTLTNQTGADVVFQITSMFTCNCAIAPTSTAGGAIAGVRRIWKTTGAHNACAMVTASSCSGGTANGSIVVPTGTANQKYWIESNSLGSSSSFSATINWRMLNAATCAVLSTGTAQTASAISPANC